MNQCIPWRQYAVKNIIIIHRIDKHYLEGLLQIVMVDVYTTYFRVFLSELQVSCCCCLISNYWCSSRVHGCNICHTRDFCIYFVSHNDPNITVINSTQILCNDGGVVIEEGPHVVDDMVVWFFIYHWEVLVQKLRRYLINKESAIVSM